MHEPDDHELLRQYAEQNSEAAFAALVGRHVDKVYSAALRHTRNAHAAEEITQAVFVILAKNSGRLGPKVILAGWLYETARLTALTYIRSEIRRARREQEAHMQTTLNENDPETWPHIAPLLDDALAKLSAADRHALVLRYFDGKSLGQVGAALGASEDPAKKRVNRAVEKLREFFTKRGVTLTATVLTAAISANSVQAAPLGLAAAVTATAAKGAAVSVSTLTLLNGALKVMAWSKIKTSIVVSGGMLLAAGTTTVVVNTLSSPDSIYEHLWRNADATNLEALERTHPVLVIRPTRYSKVGPRAIQSPSGKAVGVNLGAISLLNIAHGFVPSRIVMPASWPSENDAHSPSQHRYDYLNTLPPSTHQSELLDAIATQLGLTAHAEIRETDILFLRVKGDEKLKAAVANRSVPTSPYPSIAQQIEMYFSKPVLDQTDVSGTGISFEIDWADTILPSSGEDRKKAIQQVFLNRLDQLGLQLVPSREPVEMLVVEKVK